MSVPRRVAIYRFQEKHWEAETIQPFTRIVPQLSNTGGQTPHPKAPVLTNNGRVSVFDEGTEDLNALVLLGRRHPTLH